MISIRNFLRGAAMVAVSYGATRVDDAAAQKPAPVEELLPPGHEDESEAKGNLRIIFHEDETVAHTTMANFSPTSAPIDCVPGCLTCHVRCGQISNLSRIKNFIVRRKSK